MNKIILSLLFATAITACGITDTDKDNAQVTVDISGAKILWMGNIEDSVYRTDFHDAIQCLETKFGLSARKLPFFYKLPYALIVVDKFFKCGYVDANGCYSYDTNSVYVVENDFTSLSVKHETIHWLTKQGYEAHQSAIFTECAPLSFY